MHKPYILQTSPDYFNNILKYHGIEYTPSKGTSPYINGFTDYNYILGINELFSNKPTGDVLDRTNTLKVPFNMHIERPWTVPVNTHDSFDSCVEARVAELMGRGQKINILWSGGIDSTAVVTGFLKHCKNLGQIRILYSTLSMKENPYFYLLLQEIEGPELVEFSGDVYLEQNFDGLFVTGDGADDLTASLDQSFFEEYGYDGLHKSWKDFFFEKTNNVDFVNFCESWFEKSGRTITTVLEARWWLYANKINKFPALASAALQLHQPLVIGFFDTYQFEHYMFFNMDKIIANENYSSYKTEFKKYIYDFDKNFNYYQNKTKFNSVQLLMFIAKKTALKNHQYIMLLADGTRIRTDNLPLISEIEYRTKYHDTLGYLFNV